MRSIRRQSIFIGSGILLLLIVSLALTRFDILSDLKNALQVRSVPTSLLNYGPMGKIFKKLNLVKLEENDYQRFKASGNADNDIEAITFQKKRQVDDNIYLANPSGKLEYKSTAIAQSLHQKPGWPILSIVINERSLHDPDTGILTNRVQSGRKWERLAEVSYVEDGEVLFETYVGLRVHGGLRLITEKFAHGYKLYFRNKYGLPAVPDGVIFPEHEVPLRTLVVQTTSWPPQYPFNNPLSYDIAKQIDCKVPATRLVEIYLNGRSHGMGFVVEHLSRRQWGQRYDHNDYNFYKFRGDIALEDNKMYTKNFWRIVTEKEDLTLDNVSGKIDLDNFSRHVFSWVFCGTTDYCQGVAVYDKTDPNARISWINWDMDHSFFDDQAKKHKIKREHWQQEAFKLIYKERNHYCGRTTLFSRLMNESEEYKKYFIELVAELMNHRLTAGFLSSRVKYYKKMLAEYGQPHVPYVTMLEKFIANRSNFIFDDMANYFELTGPFHCRVNVQMGQTVLVDGYPYTKEYTGQYFKSTAVHMELPTGSKKQILYWEVNGKKVFDKSLNLELNENTSIVYALER